MLVRNSRVGVFAAMMLASAAVATLGCSSEDRRVSGHPTSAPNNGSSVAANPVPPNPSAPNPDRPRACPIVNDASSSPSNTALGGSVVAKGAAHDASGAPINGCDPDYCVGYDSITAALGELTADCRGKVDPRDYALTADGILTPTFDSCPGDATLMRPIRQLLSLQKANPQLLPRARECIAERFRGLAAKFATSGIDQCPIWSNKQPINPLDLAKFKALPWPPAVAGLDVLPELPRELTNNEDLKEKSLYTVTLPPGATPSCGTPSDCAAACASVFPGFVIPSVVPPSSPEFSRTISVDPTSWWSTRTFGSASSDPYLAQNMAYYHLMSYAAPSPPGEQFGALQRYQPCGPATTDPACIAEACSYWAGTHIRRRLQMYCNDYSDPDTCTSYCGPDL